MQQTPTHEAPNSAGMRFYITPRQSLSPGVILLAVVIAFGFLFAVRSVFSHSRKSHRATDSSGAPHPGSSASADDENEDLSTVETIYLGDPADAPVPARPGSHAGSVHPFVIVRLPRFGDQAGLIPDTAAGRLLYSWLAAFNRANEDALAKVLPNAALDATAAVQMELRKETGGFNLLSAKEVQPGVLVFRLRVQDPSATEVLGTLQMRPESSPPSIASFSLRAIPRPDPKLGTVPSGSSVTPLR